MSEGKKVTKLTIHIEEEHECGQVHESIYHMHQIHMTEAASLLPIDETTLDIFSPRLMEFTGSYNKIELNGLEVQGNKILCKKCGKDILSEEE